MMDEIVSSKISEKKSLEMPTRLLIFSTKGIVFCFRNCWEKFTPFDLVRICTAVSAFCRALSAAHSLNTHYNSQLNAITRHCDPYRRKRIQIRVMAIYMHITHSTQLERAELT